MQRVDTVCGPSNIFEEKGILGKEENKWRIFDFFFAKKEKQISDTTSTKVSIV